jgi:hypothetical protein
MRIETNVSQHALRRSQRRGIFPETLDLVFEYVARKPQHGVFQKTHCARFEPAEGQNRQTQRRLELAKGQTRKFRGR